jgi:carbamoyltransferase
MGLGPEFDQSTVEATLNELGADYVVLSEAEVVEASARAIAEDQVLGWMQGRMEFGPRSLGNRSILGNAQSATAQRQINLKIKYRESFRPFAPSVPVEAAADWFELPGDSPYMLTTAAVRACQRRVPEENDGREGLDLVNQVRSTIPAVTHVDGSARVQTVSQRSNPRFHALLRRVGELTGVPVVVNTSFNVRGEPIVCSPADAFRCFMGTEMDVLAIGNYFLKKEDQDSKLAEDGA